MAEPGFRILVVDDEELLRRLLVTALSGRGHQVETAGDGEEAARKLESGRFDLLITDFRMPKMTGIALIQWIKEKKLRIPVVLMSSNTLEEMKATFSELVGVEFLRKPFGLTDLFTAVQRSRRSSNPSN